MTRLARWLSLVGLVTAGCSVKTVDTPGSAPGPENSCVRDSDCMAGASCRAGACFAATSAVQQVVLEILPEADSPSGGLAYIATLDEVANGGTRDIALPALSRFVMQVQLTAKDALGCRNASAPVTVPARVEFNRISSVAGARIIGLPARPVTAVTAADASKTGWTASVALVPGTYDVYIEPASGDRCPLAPRLLRGVEVTDNVPGWAVPATIELPDPKVVSGAVQRRGGTLAGWTVDVIDAQDGRVLSTLATLGATDAGRITNFALQYHAVASDVVGGSSAMVAGTSALLRVAPPDNLVAPTVYWDLAVADLNGTGALDLNMTGIPTPDELVHVDGRVQGMGDDGGAPATLRFASTTLASAMALTATFTRTVKTDTEGRYGVDLFPGEYRVIASPNAAVGAASNGYPRTGASAAVPWAVTETRVVIARPQPDPLPIRLAPKRVLHGVGIAGPDGDPARGVTFNANPTLLADTFGVLRGALAQAALVPQGVSVTLGEAGAFTVPLDPGTFDLSLRPKDSSNFAWWVAPGVTIAAATNASDVMTLSPRLPLPVAIQGVIVAPVYSMSGNQVSRGLGNASMQVYARAPTGSAVTKIAETRTDQEGHYRLSLPATFGSL